MWKEVIGLKYKNEVLSKIPKGNNGVGLWNDIFKEVDS